jgi:hypothetical protein
LDNDLAQNAQEFRARRCIIIAVLFSFPYCFVIILLLVYDLIPDEIMKALDEYSMVVQYIMRILKKKYKIAQESMYNPETVSEMVVTIHQNKEHGFSALITIPRSEQGTNNSFLFDIGVSETV